MEKIDLILWFMGAGFSVILTFMLLIWNGLTSRIEKIDEKLTDVDRRLCRLEGVK